MATQDNRLTTHRNVSINQVEPPSNLLGGNRPILQGLLRQFPSILEWSISIIEDFLKTTPPAVDSLRLHSCE